MKSLYQTTIRLPMEKALIIDQIRKEKGMSWNAILELAVDQYLENVSAPADTPKVNNTEPKIALLSEKKKEEKEPETAQNGLDMSGLLGATDDNSF